MGINRFEDIVAWQHARALVAAIYATTRREPFARDFGLRDQLQRASVSTMSNIAEGFERHSPKENLHFLSIARASSGEVRSLLYVAFDIGYLAQADFDRLMGQAQSVTRLVASFRASIDRFVRGVHEDRELYGTVLDLELPTSE